MTTAEQPCTAAWQMSEGDASLTVGPAPMPTLTRDGIIVQAHAVAINPVDWAIQKLGTGLFDFLPYPLIFGFDVAGVVHAVGSEVTRFQKGDRVFGLASDGTFVPGSTSYKMESNSAFRSHSLIASNAACKIPEQMSFEEAAVLPMGMFVAASGLFMDEYLGCELPTTSHIGNHRGWLLITAGASSIGACAIQLAVAAGYRVVSTSSEGNFGRVKSLGAAEVFDYRQPLENLKDQLISFFSDKDLSGILAIGSIGDQSGTVEELCGDIFAKTSKPASVPRKFVACVSRPPKSMPDGVEYAFVHGAEIQHTPAGPAIFADFLPKALQQSQILPLPPPIIAGQGLGAIQSALDRQKAGISFAKVVVTL